MEEKSEEILTCCLCGIDIEHGMGNNPAPFQRHHAEWVVKLADRCCDWCNDMKVNPARMGLVGEAAEIVGRQLIEAKAIQMWLMQNNMGPFRKNEEE